MLFDLGTGLRYFGAQLDGDPPVPFQGTCLLSHVHWDHIQGLPFFPPMLNPATVLNVYCPPAHDDVSVADVFGSTIRPPLFPIAITEFPGTVDFHELADSEMRIGDIEITSRLIPHIGPTLGYRLDWKGRSLCYMSDHQQPPDGSFSVTPGALELCQGVDVMIHDAQYTNEEFAERSTWGHCQVDYAVWLAIEAKVKKLLLFHHDPSHTDDRLDQIVACARAAGAASGVDVIAAREGLVIELSGT